MTSEDQALDPSFFLTHQPLTLYRLARARYANLSGIGAALAPGRWNQLGQEAIYASTEIGVPVLERLAHTQKDLIPSNLALMKIRVSGRWKLGQDELVDQTTGFGICFYRSLLSAKRHFESAQRPFFIEGIYDPEVGDFVFRAKEPFALAVPSVIVPVWNVVLFPHGPGFWEHVSLESVEPLQFDPRLFPEGASVETAEQENQG